MRYIIMYFSSRIVSDVRTFIYTSRKSYQASMNVNGTSQNFSLTYWDGKPKEKQAGSFTMWLNDKSVEEIELIREVHGDECYLQVDENGNGKLIPSSEFQSLPRDEQNVVEAYQVAQ